MNLLEECLQPHLKVFVLGALIVFAQEVAASDQSVIAEG